MHVHVGGSLWYNKLRIQLSGLYSLWPSHSYLATFEYNGTGWTWHYSNVLFRYLEWNLSVLIRLRGRVAIQEMTVLPDGRPYRYGLLLNLFDGARLGWLMILQGPINDSTLPATL